MKKTLSLISMAGLMISPIEAADREVPSSRDEKASYSIGVNIGRDFHARSFEPDLDFLLLGLRDALAERQPAVSEEEARQVLTELQNELRAKVEQKRQEAAAKNMAEGQAFLAANQDQPGVTTLPSGLQYRIIENGDGRKPGPADSVTVHYEARLIDGTVVDSSHQREKPSVLSPTRIIPGWKEALQLMPIGSKWELFVPANLAYGDAGAGRNIGPGATLVFELELLDATAPAAPAKTRELSISDIIKVPSKEELEQGAEIEIIKQEDLEKHRPK